MVAVSRASGAMNVDAFAFLEIFKNVVTRQQRHFVFWTEIGKHNPITFFDRIPRLPGTCPPYSSIRFARLLETISFHVEQPAVIAAPDASILDMSIVECRAAMHAPWIEQTGTPFAVPKKN
jgi:hypothetical protein